MKKLLFALIAALLTLTNGLYAQDVAPQVAYYLAADENGIQQVYQVVLDGEYTARPISYATSDVISFGAAYDGLGIVYVSDGQLWLQSIHTEEPESVATLSATQYFGTQVFSQDGNYVAYSDNGVWLLDLATRETRQLVENIPLEPEAANADVARGYTPQMFVLDAEGKTAKLILNVGTWEWVTAGVYDLATGELQELEGHVHTELLPLSNGSVLVYGNSGFDGSSSLEIAESFDDINAYTEVLNPNALFADSGTAFYSEQAVEIAPNLVRIFGSLIAAPVEGANAFYYDYDVATDTISEVTFLTLPASTTNYTMTMPDKLSPDGNTLPLYVNPLWNDNGNIYGELQLFDLATSEISTAQFPETVGVFHWQQ